MYFDMGAFYKVHTQTVYKSDQLFITDFFRLLVIACIQSCLEAQLQVRAADLLNLTYVLKVTKRKTS